ncbi:hypothetical protein [Enterobacter sp. CC120223-11]|uniref:hypothetical protein n=1 Tax=Enterobacter sp. CC120223-11 TaxID=1378073 RepID=UPI000BD0D6D3|nr:hypothetical protein [Enterobacter sp. CC120223-11]SNY69153.1 hypothetical protein SAMN02744775_02111 [Enterobacter sp. CC120223-11]
MKTLLTTAVLATTLISGFALADDPVIPWADNSGGTETTHIAAVGQNLNGQHQHITQTQEGVWAANSGSIKADEDVLTPAHPSVGAPSPTN